MSLAALGLGLVDGTHVVRKLIIPLYMSLRLEMDAYNQSTAFLSRLSSLRNYGGMYGAHTSISTCVSFSFSISMTYVIPPPTKGFLTVVRAATLR